MLNWDDCQKPSLVWLLITCSKVGKLVFFCLADFLFLRFLAGCGSIVFDSSTVSRICSFACTGTGGADWITGWLGTERYDGESLRAFNLAYKSSKSEFSH